MIGVNCSVTVLPVFGIIDCTVLCTLHLLTVMIDDDDIAELVTCR